MPLFHDARDVVLARYCLGEILERRKCIIVATYKHNLSITSSILLGVGGAPPETRRNPTLQRHPCKPYSSRDKFINISIQIKEHHTITPRVDLHQNIYSLTRSRVFPHATSSAIRQDLRLSWNIAGWTKARLE